MTTRSPSPWQMPAEMRSCAVWPVARGGSRPGGGRHWRPAGNCQCVPATTAPGPFGGQGCHRHPHHGRCRALGSLGAFRALVQLPNREAVQSALDPRVVALLRSGDDALAVTLETYLDLGGDAKATAERLHVHRATLYFRLNKAQQLASIDVRNGYDRLAVHLGLKLVRLAGVDGEMWHQGGPVPARQTPTAGKTEEDGGLSAISARS